MPENISTNFEQFVNENIAKPKKVNKSEIKIIVTECLSSSDKKMSLFEISKSTGIKTDNVYIALIANKEIKSKKIGDVLYWYIKENQLDPQKKIAEKPSATDPIFMKLYEDDVKNNPNNRKIFLSTNERLEYDQKKSGQPVKATKKRR